MGEVFPLQVSRPGAGLCVSSGSPPGSSSQHPPHLWTSGACEEAGNADAKFHDTGNSREFKQSPSEGPV